MSANDLIIDPSPDEVTRLRAEVARLKDVVRRATEAEVTKAAEVQRLTRERDGLADALRGVRQATEESGDCWCALERLIHPADDPQDALKGLRDGHTEECWAARDALREVDGAP